MSDGTDEMDRKNTEKGWTFKDTFFPEGTQFRTIYKGSVYAGAIKNGGMARAS
jgi:hypothetical protein